MLNQSRQQSRRRAIHESSQSEMFLKIGALKRNAKSLKNTSEQIHSLVELQAAGLQLPKIRNLHRYFSKILLKF